ncbi:MULTISPECIES: HPF/RaiA family ribosome-associated protein [Xanthomonas]|uniref:HPF/RaiA family ribosome-associated protein n=1 Tax=Xanthomonas TaxID=338 RepID=UPI0005927D83|nr:MULTISPECIES: HPF/RaiA family ribosome-associated protein [Xanthomonas]MBF9171870.1 HPF/RaiA family ribosome-associated protein [Xanthomonas campestris pv. campestris]MCC3255356.1 HPF/RaiA family ribosome-associated protein [Xanthomonas campestris pv. armoraciae]MCC5045502.1 HPF/RaiA family ribosome-associated protein [Xanthomonas campestris]MCC5066164.1 HPF/RaiA family ribosome-associated protein [Xanthomonas campestris pv. raphani]MCC5069424.1 HPF/RaiA family ribosome-associated protein [
MQIQIQTDNHVPHDPSVVQHVEKTCAAQLAHFAHDITRVEVHLRDENGQRGGAADRTCSIEAHVAGLPPIAASNSAETTASAVTGAARKLRSAIESARGKQQAKATAPAPDPL